MGIEKYQSKEKQFQEDGMTFRIIVKYGMQYIKGNKVPYFSITGSIDKRNGRRWDEYSAGCIHDEIAKHFPELQPLIQFHLWGQDGIPMHYVENAVHWWECWKGLSEYADKDKTPENNYKIFADHICLFPLEKPFIPEDVNTLREWLRSRQPRIQQHFLEAMQKFNIEFIEAE